MPFYHHTSPRQRAKNWRKTKTALATACRYLMLRDYSAFELETRLQKRGFSGEEIAETVLFLKEQGYVNDQAFAKHWLHDHIAHKPWGPFRLAHELRNRGIDHDTINSLLQEMLPPDKVKARILAVGSSYYRKHKGQSACRAVARYLARLGYDASDIAQVLEKLCDSTSGLA